MTDPGSQLERFFEGVRLLGGKRAAASILGVTERTMARLAAGEVRLHAGFLRDIAAALLTRANECRELERHLSPTFHENLTLDQRQHPPHGSAYHLRGKD